MLGMLAAREGNRASAERYLRESLEQARNLLDPGLAVAALNNLVRLLADTGHVGDALALAGAPPRPEIWTLVEW